MIESVSDIYNLRIIIDVIGYRSQGESILFRIVERKEGKDITLYCLVIDCYKLRKRNVTLELLDEYEVDLIDVLCWSHPHMDHARGIEDLIREKCSNQTDYLIPSYFNNNAPGDLVSIKNKQELEIISKIFEQNAKTKTVLTAEEVKSHGYNHVDSAEFTDYQDRSIPLRVGALTPISSILKAHISNEDFEDINELSISLLISVGPYKLFFGADVINDHLKEIDSRYLKDCRFIKIPHHGSDTSESLLDLLSSAPDVAGTTVYHLGGDLPMESVVKKYKDTGCRVFCAGAYKKLMSPIYARVRYTIDFLSPTTNYCVECINGAREL